MKSSKNLLVNFKRLVLKTLLVALFCSAATIIMLTSPINIGDVNCDSTVDVYDLIVLRRYVLGIQDLDKIQKGNADINKDGIVDNEDVKSIEELIMNISRK